MEQEEPAYRMFTDIFSRLIIRDTVEKNTKSQENENSPISTPTSNNDPGVMKYAVAEEKVTINKKVQFTEDEKEKVKDVIFFTLSENRVQFQT